MGGALRCRWVDVHIGLPLTILWSRPLIYHSIGQHNTLMHACGNDPFPESGEVLMFPHQAKGVVSVDKSASSLPSTQPHAASSVHACISALFWPMEAKINGRPHNFVAEGRYARATTCNAVRHPALAEPLPASGSSSLPTIFRLTG